MTPAATSQTSPPDDLHDADRAAKPTAALIEKLTRTGHVVHQDRLGSFMVTRWNVSRFCMDLESLRAFADQVGAV